MVPLVVSANFTHVYIFAHIRIFNSVQGRRHGIFRAGSRLWERAPIGNGAQ